MMNKIDQKIQQIKDELIKIEEQVVTNYTLADAIRSGSKVTIQETKNDLGDGDTACALFAGYLDAKARGYIK